MKYASVLAKKCKKSMEESVSGLPDITKLLVAFHQFVVADEAIYGDQERSGKVEDKVLHRVAKRFVTAKGKIIRRKDRAGRGCHELLCVRAHDAVVGVFDDFPAGTESQGEHDQKEA